MPAKFQRTWIVTASWAHPIWSQYAALLFDLKTEPGSPEQPYKLKSDYNYEFHLYALAPDATEVEDADAIVDITTVKDNMKLLQPANFAYQFYCPSDEQAQRWIQSLIDLVKAVKLNPDTDATRAWNEIFRQVGAGSLKNDEGVL